MAENSSPTELVRYLEVLHQRIKHLTTDQKVVGLTPAERTTKSLRLPHRYQEISSRPKGQQRVIAITHLCLRVTHWAVDFAVLSCCGGLLLNGRSDFLFNEKRFYILVIADDINLGDFNSS